MLPSLPVARAPRPTYSLALSTGTYDIRHTTPAMPSMPMRSIDLRGGEKTKILHRPKRLAMGELHSKDARYRTGTQEVVISNQNKPPLLLRHSRTPSKQRRQETRSPEAPTVLSNHNTFSSSPGTTRPAGPRAPGRSGTPRRSTCRPAPWARRHLSPPCRSTRRCT